MIKQKRTLYIGIITAVALLILGGALFSYNQKRITVVYEPARACALLTSQVAQAFLGQNVLGGTGDQALGDTGTATSDCSYTDTSPDPAAMRVIAVKLRSGYNDEGVAQNKRDFAAHKAANDTEVVSDIGKQAFFNRTSKQLHVLTDKSWLILSYVVGQTPSDDAEAKTTAIATRMLATAR